MKLSLIEKIYNFENDYSKENIEYFEKCNDFMNMEPYMSYQVSLGICRKKISLIIPAWNASNTLLYTLQTLCFSEVCKCGEMFEVIVIDDGSDDDTFEKTSKMSFPFDLKCIKQKHLSRSAAINTGVKISKGDILIFCDADILLFPKALDELIKRQQLFWDSCVFFGFREDYNKEDIGFDNLLKFLCEKTPAFWRDNRFEYDYPHGWARNMMLSTKMLNNRKGNQNFYVSNGQSAIDNCWQLYRMVYGFMFSVSRELFCEVGGFDECLKGWGWEDSLFVAKCISRGIKIIPVPSAHCIHIYHPDRSKTKWKEAAKNFNKLTSILKKSSYKDNMNFNLEKRVVNINFMKRDNSVVPNIDFSPEVNDRIVYYYNLGNFPKLLELFKSGIIPKDKRILLETQLYMKDFSLLQGADLHQTYLGNLIALICDYEFNDVFMDFDDSDYAFYYRKLSMDEFLKRGKLYEREGQYLLSLLDYYAVLLKTYETKKFLDPILVEKIKELYDIYEVGYDTY